MLGREAYRGSLSLRHQISVAEDLADGWGRKERERERVGRGVRKEIERGAGGKRVEKRI